MLNPSRGAFLALIVDDDPNFRESLSLLVEREDFRVLEAGTLAEARKRLKTDPVDVILVDIELPDGNGLDLLIDEPIASQPDVVVLTGNATVDTAVTALRDGAIDYLVKPVERSRLKSVLAGVARTRELRGQISDLREELRNLGRFGALVGRSPAMQSVYDLLSKVAPTQASVLITGESGTGKELVAETIHRLSRRKDKLFLAVNCGAMAPNLIESELFGHEKGSFTGADRQREGYFEKASGGTVFLDEITEMPIELQVKLLRVLESSTVMRIGASQAIPIDVRVLAATNRDPKQAVQEERLREDLYYRLNVFPVALPPLRERERDVELLADHFLAEINEREELSATLSPAAKRHLKKLRWPGNVRELKNVIERAAILAHEVIEPDLLPALGETGIQPTSPAALQISVGASLEEAEKRLILATLREVNGDKKRAAEILGISVKTIYNRLSVYEASGEGLESEAKS